MNDSQKNNEENWANRRKVKRREILEKFSFYVCIPKLGYTRHQVNDISELGIGFDIATLGEFTMQKDEVSELDFYLNQSLYLKLKINVVRSIEKAEMIQEVGAIFLDTETKAYQTFLTLVHFVDQLSESGEIQSI